MIQELLFNPPGVRLIPETDIERANLAEMFPTTLVDRPGRLDVPVDVTRRGDGSYAVVFVRDSPVLAMPAPLSVPTRPADHVEEDVRISLVDIPEDRSLLVKRVEFLVEQNCRHFDGYAVVDRGEARLRFCGLIAPQPVFEDFLRRHGDVQRLLPLRALTHDNVPILLDACLLTSYSMGVVSDGMQVISEAEAYVEFNQTRDWVEKRTGKRFYVTASQSGFA